MSKYIIRDTTTSANGFLWQSGLILFCIYIAACFPGTSLFGMLPIQKISLYSLILHGIVVLFFSVRNGIHGTEHFIWYGFFTLLSLVSLVFSNGQITNSDFHSVIICFALTVIQALYIIHERAFKTICWSYIIVCLANTIILISSKALVLDAGDRLGINMGINPNVLATYLMYGLVYAIWLFLAEKHKIIRFILFIFMGLISYPLILTGGRKFFLAPILFLGVYLFFSNDSYKNTGRVKKICVFLIAFVALWYAVMNIPVLYDTLGHRLEGLLNAYTGEGEVDLSSLHRGLLRRLAIQEWLKSPIWGYGFDTFKNASLENGLSYGYSHCNFTELLYNGGLILFIAYYWFLGMILYRCIENKNINTKYRSFCIAGIIMQVFFDYGGVSYNVYQSQLFILMMYCCMKEFKNNNLFIS